MNAMKILRLCARLASVGFIVLATGQIAIASPIGIGAIRPGAVVEGFEGLTVGPNLVLIDNVFTPGINSSYTFSSGVTLTDPIPNLPFSGNVEVFDFAYGVGPGHTFFGLGANGNVDRISVVPGQTAFLASGGTHKSFSLTFSSPVFQVGGFVDSSPGDITLSTFDTFGNLLETAFLESVPVENWSNNFLGIQNSAGISKITFSAPFMVLDNLTFSYSVPEPSSLSYIVFAVIAGWIRFGGKRRSPSSRSSLST